MIFINLKSFWLSSYSMYAKLYNSKYIKKLLLLFESSENIPYYLEMDLKTFIRTRRRRRSQLLTLKYEKH